MCVLFWSGNFIIGRLVHEDVEPVQLALFRWAGVALIVLPVFIKSFSKIKNTLKENFTILSVLSLLGITAFNTILYKGLEDTTATSALLINSFVPILILILSYFILKVKIKPIQFFGIVISTAGVVFLILRGEIINISQLELNHGDIWVITSSIMWALYSVLVKFKPKNLNDFEFLQL